MVGNDKEVLKVGEYRVGTNGAQNLYKAKLFGACLRFLNLQNADLRFADLRGCDFVGADLTGAQLLGAHLADADFFLAKVTLPEGWELVNGRAHKKLNWRFDHKGRAVYQDRDVEARRLENLYDRTERDFARWEQERQQRAVELAAWRAVNPMPVRKKVPWKDEDVDE